jgi:hypothetical protein
MLHLHAVVLLVLLLLTWPHSSSDAPSAAAVMPAHSRAQMHSAAVGRFFGRSIAEVHRLHIACTARRGSCGHCCRTWTSRP